MMRMKRQSSSVDLLKLIKKIDCFESTLVCVFEGEDAKYYGSRIDQYFNELKRKNLSCKGKEKVLALKRNIEKNSSINNAKIMYFVDKDFDEKEEDFNLYCTPCYSIENFYADSSTLRRVLTDELGLCEFRENEIINEIIRSYQSFESECDAHLIDLNAWIMSRVKDNDSSVKLNLNNHEVEKFISYNQGVVVRKYTLDKLDETFSINKQLCQDLLQTCITAVENSDLNSSCRGKYRLEYFRLYLVNLFEMARNKTDYFEGLKIKPKLSLTKMNIVSELSQYSNTPACLGEFLSSYKNRVAA